MDIGIGIELTFTRKNARLNLCTKTLTYWNKSMDSCRRFSADVGVILENRHSKGDEIGEWFCRATRAR
jgi:hypothetical protein